jgi:hypothetical protein
MNVHEVNVASEVSQAAPAHWLAWLSVNVQLRNVGTLSKSTKIPAPRRAER